MYSFFLSVWTANVLGTAFGLPEASASPTRLRVCSSVPLLQLPEKSASPTFLLFCAPAAVSANMAAASQPENIRLFDGHSAVFGPSCDEKIIQMFEVHGGVKLPRDKTYGPFDVDFYIAPAFLKYPKHADPEKLKRAQEWMGEINPQYEKDPLLLNFLRPTEESWILACVEEGQMIETSSYDIYTGTAPTTARVYAPLASESDLSDEDNDASLTNRNGDGDVTEDEEETYYNGVVEDYVLKVYSKQAGIGIAMYDDADGANFVVLNPAAFQFQGCKREIVHGKIEPGAVYRIVRVGATDVRELDLEGVVGVFDGFRNQLPYEVAFSKHVERNSQQLANSGSHEQRVEVRYAEGKLGIDVADGSDNTPVVEAVRPGSQSAKKGIKEGMRVVAVGNVRVLDSEHLVSCVKTLQEQKSPVKVTFAGKRRPRGTGSTPLRSSTPKRSSSSIPLPASPSAVVVEYMEGSLGIDVEPCDDGKGVVIAKVAKGGQSDGKVQKDMRLLRVGDIDVSETPIKDIGNIIQDQQRPLKLCFAGVALPEVPLTESPSLPTATLGQETSTASPKRSSSSIPIPASPSAVVVEYMEGSLGIDVEPCDDGKGVVIAKVAKGGQSDGKVQKDMRLLRVGDIDVSETPIKDIGNIIQDQQRPLKLCFAGVALPEVPLTESPSLTTATLGQETSTAAAYEKDGGSSSIPSRERAQIRESSSTIVVEYQEGSLGFDVEERSSKGNGAVVINVATGGQSDGSVQVGMELFRVGDINVANSPLVEIEHLIKGQKRPFKLSFTTPKSPVVSTHTGGISAGSEDGPTAVRALDPRVGVQNDDLQKVVEMGTHTEESVQGVLKKSTKHKRLHNAVRFEAGPSQPDIQKVLHPPKSTVEVPNNKESQQQLLQSSATYKVGDEVEVKWRMQDGSTQWFRGEIMAISISKSKSKTKMSYKIKWEGEKSGDRFYRRYPDMRMCKRNSLNADDGSRISKKQRR